MRRTPSSPVPPNPRAHPALGAPPLRVAELKVRADSHRVDQVHAVEAESRSRAASANTALRIYRQDIDASAISASDTAVVSVLHHLAVLRIEAEKRR